MIERLKIVGVCLALPLTPGADAAPQPSQLRRFLLGVIKRGDKKMENLERRKTDRPPDDDLGFFVGLKNAVLPSLAIWAAIALVLFAIFGELLL